MKCKAFHRVFLGLFLLAASSLPSTAQSSPETIRNSTGNPGDANGDGVVNCVDFNFVHASFGKYKDQPGYSSAADLNHDGMVNIQDLSTVARNLQAGTVCPAQNKYQAAGEQFLDQLNSAFYKTSNGLGLYADSIDGSTGQQGANSFLFSTDYLLHALYWGARVDSKYQPGLSSLISATSWYKNGPGYGTLHNAQRFFDDNSNLGSILMDIYLNELPQQSVLDESLFALNYVYSNVDAQGGIPQTEKDLGEGKFYMNVVLELAKSFTNYYVQSGDSNDLSIAEAYFKEVNDPALGLITKNGLFIGGTTYSNGSWTPNNVGPLSGNSTHVINLALALYQATGDTTYLTYAQQLLPKVLAQYYTPGAGVSSISVYGGFGLVDTLCQMYQIDHDMAWYNDAKDIVDFLLNNARDTAGWFPDGTTSTGRWNIVRTGNPPDAKVTVITQAAAAAAILEFAYTDIHK